MSIKSVVKVMNFHSLLRVDSSRKRALHYSAMENELADMMKIILNNRNLRLDKLVRLPKASLPVLRIYIGSDYGFCGNVNTSVSSLKSKGPEGAESIVIGKKLRSSGENVLFLLQEDLEQRLEEIREYFVKAVWERCWSAVELVYNRYYDAGTIRPEVRRIFPLELSEVEGATRNTTADFLIEGDPEELLQSLTVSYLMFELKIALASAYASENLMRQNSTSESLRKIDELEEEELRENRRRKNSAAFQKTVDSYIKQKALERT